MGLVPSIYTIRNKVYKENKINIENLSNKKQELNMIAAYIKQEDGTYKASNEIPSSGYTINEEKSVCSNGAKASWKENKLILSNLTKNGTNCYLYFDGKASDTILGDITPNPGSDSFTGPETADKGMFTGTDNDGTTYYYRGAVTNNYLKFANKWWRIIRINGDGTIRIIYDGTEYHANGTYTSDSQIGEIKFNLGYKDNAYVGFMYGQTGSSTYVATHTNTNKSTIMTELEIWYANNLAAYESKIDMNAGFCGDRSINTGSEVWWSQDTKKGYGTNYTAYGAYGRTNLNSDWRATQTPTFNCPNTNDLYTVKGATKGNKTMEKPIGLITADEVIYAGGFGGKTNTSYYLYNGQYYWTMSPYSYSGFAYVFAVYSNGMFGCYAVGNMKSVRPVINLRADVPITGSGTGEDPFVVN